MKYLPVFASLLLVVSTGTFALLGDTNYNQQRQDQNQQQQQKQGQWTDQSNSQSVNFYKPDIPTKTKMVTDSNTDTQNIRQNPNVVAPDLITSVSQDLCLGSAVLGGAGGGVGLNFGGTKVDSNCVRLRDVRQLNNLGYASVARERACDSLRVYAAFKRSGMPCLERANFESELKVARMVAPE